ncbi:YpmS family protein [Psychrobacillus sp.]|uniref:YpmS family protein n=1 Tax=Psychrobacillus sp. TaxID=1871623 RepID=UPI0028BD950B|nr:YpmS family protein [Psychrobacillus sp.]
MNKWKIAFFLLVFALIGSAVGLFYLISTPTDTTYIEPKTVQQTGNILTVNTTKEDFEGIANTFMAKAMEGKPLPLKLSLEDQVILSTELTIFSYTLPVKMFFEPFVDEDGNIRLEQSSLEIGRIKIPPETVLEVLKDSIELPEWMIVNPAKKEVLIQLASIPMSSGVYVRAKELNLGEDIITLEIIIPTK